MINIANMGNTSKVERHDPYPVVLRLNPKVSEGTQILVSNIFLEFSRLKSAKKRDYSRRELSQLVRSRNWHSKELNIITSTSQLHDHMLETTFRDRALFDEFRDFVVFEFSFLALPTGTLLATVERPSRGKVPQIRKIKVQTYCEVSLNLKTPKFRAVPRGPRQAGAIAMHVESPGSPIPAQPPAYYVISGPDTTPT